MTRDESDPNYTVSGIFGDATLATVEKGERALAILTEEWLKTLDGFSQVPIRRGE